MNKQVLSLPLDLIEVGERLRAIDADYVALIAASMAERGQDTPVTVTEADANGRHRLIAGGHRMAAARAAGLPRIDAIVSDANEQQAKLLEIDENLMRRELSQLDRAVFLVERQRVWEELHPETAHGKAKKSKGLEKTTSLSSFAESFTAATAAKLGVDVRTIQRAVARAKIDPHVRAQLAAHPVADSGAELDKIAAQPVLMQAKIAVALTRADNPARSVAAALAEFAGPPRNAAAAETQRQFQALMSAWRKGGKAARKLFLDHLEMEGEVTRPAKEKRA